MYINGFSKRWKGDRALLFGVVMGLAKQNNVKVNFPAANFLFRYILEEEVTPGLDDLIEYDPVIASSFEYC